MTQGTRAPVGGAVLTARIEQARQRSRAQGLKWTPQREHVLRLLLARGGAAKAYDLLADWQREQAGASVMAVYRALEWLVALGVVHRVEAGSLFVACAHPDAPHHDAVFLVCADCDDAAERSQTTLSGALAGLTQDSGFAVHHIEITGRCGRCQAATPAAQATTD